MIFAEGKFYLATQMKTDYVSEGPWVDGVELRVGLDTSNDGKIDQWTDWTALKENDKGIAGFAKQVAVEPAQMDLSTLPKAYGYQFEIRLKADSKTKVKPVLDQLEVEFE